MLYVQKVVECIWSHQPLSYGWIKRTFREMLHMQLSILSYMATKRNIVT